MNPPTNGASSGPEKTVMEKTVIAMPRWRLENMSANTAPTHVKGQAPKNPAKKRPMKTVWLSLATATAMLNIENPKDDISSGVLRPNSSEDGAHTCFQSVFGTLSCLA